MELQRIQKEMERRDWARIAHETATDLLLQMIPTVMDKLRERRLMIEPILLRSIAADTRELEADKAQFNDIYRSTVYLTGPYVSFYHSFRVPAVTSDFLPWLCSKAGMEAEHAITRKHLSDGTVKNSASRPGRGLQSIAAYKSIHYVLCCLIKPAPIFCTQSYMRFASAMFGHNEHMRRKSRRIVERRLGKIH
jgi:hypothetical protein